MVNNHFIHTEIGPRVENQDAVEVANINGYLIGCIADGVGGENCGRIASTKSIETFLQTINLPDMSLYQTIQGVHNTVVAIQESNPACRGMASTFTACAIKDNKLLGCQVGDTRLCVLRGNGIKQLSVSHTEAARLYESGHLSKEAYINYPRKHIIESAIGIKTPPVVQLFQFDLQPHDRLLLTSDGVHDIITKLEFRDISLVSPDLQSFGENIKRLLKTRKLQDNATFLLLAI